MTRPKYILESGLLLFQKDLEYLLFHLYVFIYMQKKVKVVADML